MLARTVTSSPSRLLLAAVVLASSLSACSLDGVAWSSGISSTCSSSAQFGCLRSSHSYWWPF